MSVYYVVGVPREKNGNVGSLEIGLTDSCKPSQGAGKPHYKSVLDH